MTESEAVSALVTATPLAAMVVNNDVLGARTLGAFMAQMQAPVLVTCINLCNLDIGLSDLEALVRFLAITKPHLTELRLPVNCIEDEGACLLAAALCGIPTLQQLCLCSNMIGSEGAMALATLLAQPSSALRLLDLSSNLIASEGVASIAAVLPHTRVLAVLRLRGNPFEAGDVELLADALRTNYSVLELEVDGPAQHWPARSLARNRRLAHATFPAALAWILASDAVGSGLMSPELWELVLCAACDLAAC
jgi:hypothetical protein